MVVVLIIGFNNAMVEEEAEEVNINVAINNGTLKSGHIVSVLLQMQSSQGKSCYHHQLLLMALL